MKVSLTCVSCGNTMSVDEEDTKRSHKCPECGEPMVEKRRPGDTSHTPQKA
jgi:predicted RNA-binding Zn-ribbon protein involved in translation (DUF1610 family)